MQNYISDTLSPLDGRYKEKIAELTPIFSEPAFMRFRLTIEARWLQSLASLPQIPLLYAKKKEIIDFAKQVEENFDVKSFNRIKELEKTTKHDVKAIEYFLAEELIANKLKGIEMFLHFAITSEDINNLAHALMLKVFRNQVLLPNIDALLEKLRELAHEYAAEPMLSHTHGQPATPTTIGKELANFVIRLERIKKSLLHLSIMGKFNGTVGNFNALKIALPEIDWRKFAENFVAEMGLNFNSYTTQIEPHDAMAEFFNYVSLGNTILIDFCRDIWGYISLNYFQQKVISTETGSSIMPHKVNPIDFENAEGNLGLANALLNHFSAKLPISRWQRDLSDSTVLRNLGVAFGYATLAYKNILQGLSKISLNHDVLNKDLDDHPEIIAEAIQTIMRLNGIANPYEKLKKETRGKKIKLIDLQNFIKKSDLPANIKEKLLKLTPATYIGYAKELAEKV